MQNLDQKKLNNTTSRTKFPSVVAVLKNNERYKCMTLNSKSIDLL